MSFDLAGVVALVTLTLSIVGGAAVTAAGLADVKAGLAKVREDLSDALQRLARIEGAHIAEWHPGDD